MQLDFFKNALPEGLTYRPSLISVAEEKALIANVSELPFREFEFHGYVGKRRVVSFGWKYDFSSQRLQKADDVPDYLIGLRELAGEFAGLDPEALQQVLVTEYASGAGIGWHRDKAVFGEVVGFSLVTPCRLRFRRKAGDGWQRANLNAEPRSAYHLRGPVRSEWEHSISRVDTLRYSITFRSMR